MTNIFRDVTYHIFTCQIITWIDGLGQVITNYKMPDTNYILLLIVLHKILCNFVGLVWLFSGLPSTFGDLRNLDKITGDIIVWSGIWIVIALCIARFVIVNIGVESFLFLVLSSPPHPLLRAWWGNQLAWGRRGNIFELNWSWALFTWLAQISLSFTFIIF